MGRFSIAGLMGGIAVFSMAWASIRYASGPSGDLVFTATLGVLGVAALGGIFRRGESRVRWAGFALLGGGYLALCYGPGSGTEVRSHLTTSTLLEWVGPRVVHPRVVTAWSDGRRSGTFSSILACPDDLVSSPPNNQPVVTAINISWPAVTWTRAVGMGNPEDFQRVGHCWLALLLGVIGGGLARRFHLGATGRPRLHLDADPAGG